MGMWVEYEERFTQNGGATGGPIAENAPPISAVGVILLILVISALLYLLHRSLKLATAELVVIYTALLVAAPLMTQGMWYRLFGLMAAVPHNQDFKTYESLPPMLWPHGPNLVKNGRFLQKLDGYTVSGGPVQWEQITWKGRTWHCPVLDHGQDAHRQTSVSFTIPMQEDGTTLLVPGELYFFSCLIRAADFTADSMYQVSMQADDGRPRVYLASATESPTTFTNPTRLQRIGISPLVVPASLRSSLTITITLRGQGTLLLHDVEFFNSQAIEGGYMGRNVVRQRNLAALDAGERNFTLVKPDNMFSLAGLRYLLTGFIPISQWVQPILAWLSLVGALFLGFFGFNVLMRRQWVEYERFTFPMNIVPRFLFGSGEGEGGVFRNKVMWAGFAVILPLVLLKGLHFYLPLVPGYDWNDIWYPIPLAKLSANPLWIAFFQKLDISLVFTLLAIALLVQTDLLFSIWAVYLLYQLLPFCGSTFNFTRFAGYPWHYQQAIGSFIAYALIAIYAARRHLAAIFRHLFGRQPLDDSDEVVPYRVAVLCVFASLVLFVAWGLWTKMGAWTSLLFFGYMLIVGFAGSKIRAECGLPFGYWAPYYNMFFMSALGGVVVFGTTGMLVASIASSFMSVACFFFISPVQVEMMELGRFFRVRPRDIGHGLWLGLLGGVLIGGFTMLCWMYGTGADNRAAQFPYQQNYYFNNYRTAEQVADNALASGTLITPDNTPLDVVHNVDAKGIAIGIVVTCVLAFLRGIIPAFPLHPLGYVLATSYFAYYVWFTCFAAWLIRSLVFRLAGTRAIRNGLVPFAVGMFLACVVGVVCFTLLGLYLRTLGVTEIYSRIP